jgi:SAM-dependent methyltransferase
VLSSIFHDTSMDNLICPVCKGEIFQDFANRLLARCATCGSLERTRAVYLVLDKFKLVAPGARILHFAPEKCLMDFFMATHSETYQPCDLSPEKYSNNKLLRLDICEDLYSMPSDSWDVILHNHVLEHILCSVKGVLKGFARILKPGGSMVFTIPVWKGTKSIEDLNPHLSDEERFMRFGQHDHVRIFGDDVLDIIKNALGKDCVIPLEDYLTEEESLRAGIPWQKGIHPTGNSVFWFRKEFEE